MPHDLPKTYEPGAIEERWANYWIEQKLFSVPTPAERAASGDARPVFTLLLPPPNVTGRLHMGHMLNQTQMDIIVRWHRMKGFLALWLPGTDHAGIATQLMVEKRLAAQGKTRHELGREAFLEQVWAWKAEYGGAILDQMKRLGASVDWDRLYFTMDENLLVAVKEAFVRLYEQGLIYRGAYMVNWCPRCGTAISDLEVVHTETNGKIWELRYPVVSAPGEPEESIVVATTRPETMLGDAAIAINATDERYTHLHGRSVRLPLMNREIPIILDDLANPEFGTGAVKVTPAHDPNDFAAGKRHNLPQIDVMDETAHMNANAGAYAGLDRYAARKRVLADLAALGVLVSEKDHVLSLGRCQRCETVAEPRISTQWFVKIEPLAKRAIAVAENGSIKFVPEQYKATYLRWMYNIHDWCISRQLWWGHRIPAWHCAECHGITVDRGTPEVCGQCGSAKITQDPDVLDTWFSSGLLPFTTLGWPANTRDAEVFYPTSLMVTGFDILFFWLARMVMLGCHFMNGHQQDAAVKAASGWNASLADPLPESKDDTVPFRHIYIHALVRDANRQKMSKTKGNVLDPIEVIAKYGTDATRFTLAAMASPGTDIAFNEERTDGYRAFANKIWNAARFLFMYLDKAEAAGVWQSNELGAQVAQANGLAGFVPETLEDRWILSRFNRVAAEVNESLQSYRFHEAANRVYEFFWGEFCDWYIELVKPRIGATGEVPAETLRPALGNLISVFEGALRLLHPFMPFLTEELWHALYAGKPPLVQGKQSIAFAAFPQGDMLQMDMAAEADMAVLQELIVGIRNQRMELKTPPKDKIPVWFHAPDAAVSKMVHQNRSSVERLANLEELRIEYQSMVGQPEVRTTSKFEFRLVYAKLVDEVAERERLTKELAEQEKRLASAQRQLGNEGFLAKAPAPVVAKLRETESDATARIQKAQVALHSLDFF